MGIGGKKRGSQCQNPFRVSLSLFLPLLSSALSSPLGVLCYTNPLETEKGEDSEDGMVTLGRSYTSVFVVPSRTHILTPACIPRFVLVERSLIRAKLFSGAPPPPTLFPLCPIPPLSCSPGTCSVGSRKGERARARISKEFSSPRLPFPPLLDLLGNTCYFLCCTVYNRLWEDGVWNGHLASTVFRAGFFVAAVRMLRCSVYIP